MKNKIMKWHNKNMRINNRIMKWNNEIMKNKWYNDNNNNENK